jgi:hypothetical protein
MAITVKHKFVSAIPDAGDTTIVQPSNWNDDHQLSGTVPPTNGGTGASTLTGYVKGNGTATMTASATVPSTDITGLGTMSTQNANAIAVTGGTMSGVSITGYIPTTEKAVANGVATLDGGGTVPVSQLPAAVLGALSYQGTWNASTNTPTLTSSVGTKGYYYVVNVAGSTNLNGINDWQIGDWAVYNGSAWQKIDNTDAVTSVNGYTGTVVLTQPDISGTVPTSRTINTGTGLTGGGDLSANRTISFSTAAVGTWAATPTSANLAAAVTDETGSGGLVFATGPTLNNPTISNYEDFGNGSATTLAAGRFWYDGSTGSWNAGMGGGNITQQIGEELFVYGKASAAITDSPLQIVYHTGTVGASGTITFAPTIAGITDENAILGVATENIAHNGFGRVTAFGVVHGITTNGTAFGETWADDDVIWYNPVTGNPTKVKPVAPNIKFQIGTVINAGSGGSGSFQVALVQGSALGGTDSNVQLTSPTAANLLTYSTTSGYWKNTALTAGTGISVGNASSGVVTVTNSAPDQTVVLTAGTGISTSGTYPNFTITNTSPSSGGTVTSVTATAPVASTGGTTPVISMPVATSSVNGYLSSTDWTTFNNKGSGTVTSVTGTAPVVSSGGATPAISMAAANTTTNGYLTSTDWNTFNGKGSGTVTSVALTAPSIFTVTGSPVTSSGTLALTYSGTALPILNGGTGQTTASAAFNALSPITTTGDLILGNGTNSATRLGIGASTYVLTSNGTTASWAAPSGGSSAFYTRTSFTATAGQTTFTVSYTAGQIQVYVNGAMLNGSDYTATNGTSVVLALGRSTNDIVEMVAFTTGSTISTTGALVWQSVKTANFTAVSGNAYPVNTTSGAVTVTLPSSPAAGAYVTIVDYAGTAATNNITVAGNSSNIQGSSNNGLIAVNRQAYNFVYIDSTQGWISYAQEYSSASQPYTASYLVIAGGGGGGYIQGGGGGAGGLLSSTTTLTPATTYSFVIGAGGAGSTVSGTNGVNGVNTTAFGLTAIGGGGGGSESYPTDAVGSSGGSGGGGSSGSTNGVAGGSGTSGQGNSGGTAYTNGSYSLAGGGGGASAVGQNAFAGGPAGTGGAGTASSITGSSVTYAGGGGGGADYRSSNNNGGAGGAGGGGAGAGGSNSYVSVAGTANTGGGGGGGSYKTGGIGTVGAAGGSGVVILSVPTTSYSGTTTGSPTITTSGSNTIIKYTSSGSYTA